jgi:hypothetical protein
MARNKAKHAKNRRKAVGRAPVWLKTAAISIPQGPKPIRGTFGAASPVVSIDPKTGLPREGQA